MPHTMEAYLAAGFGTLATLLLTIAVTLLRAQGKTLAEHGTTLVQISTVLMGANGDNGINSEVKKLREWRHDDMVQWQQTTELRLAAVERRGAEPGRRVGDAA